ncbi:MAG: hypothetical protein ACRCST_03750 [Turicibacter sp.]
MTGEPVNQFKIFAAMADKLLAIHQQATAGQGDSLNPVIFSPQKDSRQP